MFAYVSPGLSRRVIVKDAETGRTQTYSTGSDVLAQQFAVRVGPAIYCRFFQQVKPMWERGRIQDIIPSAHPGPSAVQRMPIWGNLQHWPAAARPQRQQQEGQPLPPRVGHHLAAHPAGWELPDGGRHAGPGQSFCSQLYRPVHALGMTPTPPLSLKALWQHLCLLLSCTDQAVGHSSDQTSAGVQGALQWTRLPSGPCVRRWGAFAGR